MQTFKFRIISLVVLLAYGVTFATLGGCNSEETETTTTTSASDSDAGHDEDGHDHDHDHDHGDHDHGDHDHGDHDHPAHGPNGGHMATLDDGSDVEWMMDKESGVFTVIFDDPEKVAKVAFETTVGEVVTPYALEKADDGSWTTTNPELATAVLMGKAVTVKLLVTTDDGQASAEVEHHEH